MLGNADTDQSKESKFCYIPDEDSCNSPIKPSDRRNNFVPLAR